MGINSIGAIFQRVIDLISKFILKFQGKRPKWSKRGGYLPPLQYYSRKRQPCEDFDPDFSSIFRGSHFFSFLLLYRLTMIIGHLLQTFP